MDTWFNRERGEKKKEKEKKKKIIKVHLNFDNDIASIKGKI